MTTGSVTVAVLMAYAGVMTDYSGYQVVPVFICHNAGIHDYSSKYLQKIIWWSSACNSVTNGCVISSDSNGNKDLQVNTMSESQHHGYGSRKLICLKREQSIWKISLDLRTVYSLFQYIFSLKISSFLLKLHKYNFGGIRLLYCQLVTSSQPLNSRRHYQETLLAGLSSPPNP